MVQTDEVPPVLRPEFSAPNDLYTTSWPQRSPPGDWVHQSLRGMAVNACGCGKPALVGYQQWAGDQRLVYWWCLTHIPAFVIDELIQLHEVDFRSDHSV